VRYIMSVALLGLALSGCSSGSSPSKATETSTGANTAATRAVSPTHGAATPRPDLVAVDRGFAHAVRTLCAAFARKDASAVTSALPYYQYNSGLRYGTFGDGEGQTGDPSLMATWLSHSHVQCKFQSSGSHGHGTVLATGWPQQGGTALIEFDTYSGRWKVNDFTFGAYGPLWRAMQTANPLRPYAG
jgi:hypothetical protein